MPTPEPYDRMIHGGVGVVFPPAVQIWPHSTQFPVGLIDGEAGTAFPDCWLDTCTGVVVSIPLNSAPVMVGLVAVPVQVAVMVTDPPVTITATKCSLVIPRPPNMLAFWENDPATRVQVFPALSTTLATEVVWSVWINVRIATSPAVMVTVLDKLDAEEVCAYGYFRTR